MTWDYQQETPIHNESYFTNPSAVIGGLVIRKPEGWEAWVWWPKQPQFKVGECYKTNLSAKAACMRIINAHKPGIQ